MNIFAIVGHSDSGKTQLIRQLIPELKMRGLSVAVIKHCPEGFAFDKKGKDSWYFMEANSDGVALVSPDQSAVFQKRVKEKNLSAIGLQYFKDVDIVLVEGGRGEKEIKKIEVLRKGIAEEVTCSLDELIAVVYDGEITLGRPVFHPEQINEIAIFLEKSVKQRKSQVILEIDETSVAMNAFVQKIFKQVVSGMIHSLDGIQENPERITLTVIRKEKDDE